MPRTPSRPIPEPPSGGPVAADPESKYFFLEQTAGMRMDRCVLVD